MRFPISNPAIVTASLSFTVFKIRTGLIALNMNQKLRDFETPWSMFQKRSKTQVC